MYFTISDNFTASVTGQYIKTEGGATFYAHSPNGLQLDANDFDSVIDANVVVVFVTLIVTVLIPSLLVNVVPLLFKVCLWSVDSSDPLRPIDPSL